MHLLERRKALVSYSRNHICGDFRGSNGGSWRFIGICSWPDGASKVKTWDLMRSFSSFQGPMFSELIKFWVTKKLKEVIAVDVGVLP